MINNDRLVKEMWKAFSEKKPSQFFSVLRDVNALEKIFPEVNVLVGQTQPEKWHGEGDAFIHTLMVMDEASERTNDPEYVFYALCHDLGKGLTPKNLLPHHKGHEYAGVPVTENLCNRLNLQKFKNTAMMITKYHMHVHKAFDLNPKTFVNVFEDIKSIDIIKKLTIVSECDHYGRLIYNKKPDNKYHEKDYFNNVMFEIASVKVSNFMTNDEIQNTQGLKIRERLRNERIKTAKKVISELKKSYSQNSLV